VGKFGTAAEDTDDNIIQRMRFACRITKARVQTHTQNMYYLWLFHCKNGYANAPQCSIICTLPIFLNSKVGSYRLDFIQRKAFCECSPDRSVVINIEEFFNKLATINLLKNSCVPESYLTNQ
jgi:hypothetical protein